MLWSSDHTVFISLLQTLINSTAIFSVTEIGMDQMFFMVLIIILEFYSKFKINLSCRLVKFKAPLNFSKQIILYLLYT